MVPFHESLTSCFNINTNAQLHLQQLTCNLLLLKFIVRYLHFSLSGSRNRGKKKHPMQVFHKYSQEPWVYAQLKRAVDNSTNSCVLEFISEPDVATSTAPHAIGICTMKIGDNEAFRLSFRSCRSSLERFCPAPMKEPGLITAKTAHGSHAYVLLIYFVRPEAAGLKVPVGD